MFKLNLAIVAVVLAATAAFTWGLLLPGTKDLRERREQIAAGLDKIEKTQRAVGDVGSLYASIQSLNAETQNFREQLPEDRRFGQFLNDLSGCLEKSKIADYAIQPLPSRVVIPEQLPEDLKLAKGTVILPVRILFESSFEHVFGFLARMESLKRLCHVENLELANDESRPGHVKIDLELHAYHQPAG